MLDTFMLTFITFITFIVFIAFIAFITFITFIVFIAFIAFIMITWTGLFLLCIVMTPALCCDWLRHYGHFSNITLTHLSLMGDQLTEQEPPVSFPYKLYKDISHSKVSSKVVFIRDSMVQIADLYRHSNLSLASWDADNTNRFRMSIDRQIAGLNTCVSTNQTVNLRLRKYYRKLRNIVLDRTGAGPASWELIRKETELHLHQLDLLVAEAQGLTEFTRR